MTVPVLLPLYLFALSLHDSSGFQLIGPGGTSSFSTPTPPHLSIPTSVASCTSDDVRVGASLDSSSSDYVNPIVVTSSIVLPFSSDVAYDAFSDLPRQPSWSPWLREVCYVDEPLCHLSKWTMRMAGLSFSWKSISTRNDRPHVIEWESVSGIRNKGRVEIRPAVASDHERSANEEVSRGAPTPCCHMTLTMVFQAPRIVAALFRNDFSAIQAQMEERILRRTLHNFREVVLRQDLTETHAVQERILRESGMLFPN